MRRFSTLTRERIHLNSKLSTAVLTTAIAFVLACPVSAFGATEFGDNCVGNSATNEG